MTYDALELRVLSIEAIYLFAIRPTVFLESGIRQEKSATKQRLDIL
ncbi:hypothetical protein [Psychrobacter sp. TWR1-1-1]